MFYNGLEENKFWRAVEPALNKMADETVGLTSYGKSQLLQGVKKDLSQIPKEAILDDRLEESITKVVKQWFDNRSCLSCSHDKVCLIKEQIDQTRNKFNITARCVCDNWGEAK